MKPLPTSFSNDSEIRYNTDLFSYHAKKENGVFVIRAKDNHGGKWQKLGKVKTKEEVALSLTRYISLIKKNLSN